MLTVVDGAKAGGPDKFRIKIWDKVTDQVIYDNQMNTADDDDELSDSTAIGGGSIVIHSN